MDWVLRVYRGWRKSPPTHWMTQLLAHGIGVYTPQTEAPAPRASTDAEIDAFIRETGKP